MPRGAVHDEKVKDVEVKNGFPFFLQKKLLQNSL